MVKSLGNICVKCIVNNLQEIPNIEKQLPRIYKELILTCLSEHELLTQDNLRCISKELFVKTLQHIELCSSDQITDEVLILLAASKPSLKTLTINNCSNVTDVGIQAITKGQNCLESLVLKKLNNLTPKGLTHLKSQRLQSLDLKKCPQINSEGLRSILRNNNNVKVLHLAGRGCHKLDDSVVIYVAETLGHNLEELHYVPHDVSNETVKFLGQQCPNLRILNLYGCSRMTGQGLMDLTKSCTNLKNLDLSYCVKLSQSPDNQSLWTLPTSLTTLSLVGILLEDELLLVECLQRLRKLKSVRLCGVTALNDKTMTEILQHIGKNLTELDLSGTRNPKLTDDGLAAVTEYCVSLETLNLSMCNNFTGESLLPMLENPKRAQIFTKIFIASRKAEMDVLTAIAKNCSNLHTLDITGLTIVTDQLLSLLVENCPKLQRLGMKGCSKVTDEGVCKIACHCQHLKFLVLSGIINLTDKSIFCIANHCPELTEIYLNGCKNISPTTLQYLQDCCISDVYIQHVTPSNEPDQLMAKNLDTGEFCRVDRQEFNMISM